MGHGDFSKRYDRQGYEAAQRRARLRKIVTEHVFPPIPIRSMDWIAYYEGEEEAGGYGEGPTEEAAVADFIENYQEDHDRRLGVL